VPATPAPQVTWPAATTPAPPAAATAPTPVGESAPELYDRALKTIREKQDFSAGRDMMETFLKRYPDHDLAVNAAYWIGETFYAEKNYEQAILKFEEIIQKYGDHPKVASAMLKQALAFESSGDKGTARLLMQRVIERFPLSDEAGKAREKLKAG
jgi:tol-pal system protein YbgF